MFLGIHLYKNQAHKNFHNNLLIYVFMAVNVFSKLPTYLFERAFSMDLNYNVFSFLFQIRHIFNVSAIFTNAKANWTSPSHNHMHRCFPQVIFLIFSLFFLSNSENIF